MTMKVFLQVLALVALASSLASAFDPSPLQDICVAVDNPLNGVFVNGKFCKDPQLATPEDFYFSVKNPGNTSNPLGSNATSVDVDQIPGLNTLGVSAQRIDFAPNGENPPHIHPRASELIVVVEGTLRVGFITSDPENKLFTKVLNKWDFFVFPIAHIHFQFNIGNTTAVAFSAYGSQNPGEITIANSVFGSSPAIDPDFLARAFQLDVDTVKALQNKTWIS